jgi:hypothetical protein
MARMKLMTKAIEKKAQKQFPMGSDMEQMVVAKFFNPTGGWTWYLMNQDPNDTDYLWGIVKGFEVEVGSFSLSELTNFRGQFGLGIERDRFFKPMKAKDVFKALNEGKHI